MKTTMHSLIFLLLCLPGIAQQKQTLTGHVPPVVSKMKAVKKLTATKKIDLVISLPLRNQQELTTMIQDTYDPAGKSYRHYLTPAQFNEKFAPAATDYQRLIDYAKANKFTVVTTKPNHTMLRVRATVSDINKALKVNLQTYKDPAENRTFYSTDIDPSVDTSLHILHISGLDDYQQPQKHSTYKLIKEIPVTKKGPFTAEEDGPGGSSTFGGMDFRAAYAPGVSLTGTGQVVGILSMDGYYPSDIRDFEVLSGFNAVPLQNIYLNGHKGTPDVWNLEVSLDIEMAISMAPGLSRVVVYGIDHTSPNIDEVLNEMANPSMGEPLPNQISTSMALTYDPSVYQSFQQMAMQGQTFFAYSGDNGAYTSYTKSPKDILPFPPGDYGMVTSVGGTMLTTNGTGGPWFSETAWPFGGGGPSPWFRIPSWQWGIVGGTNLASATWRNCPDVSMVSSDIFVVSGNGKKVTAYGTSASSPLWAGFMALVNQQAEINHLPPVGYINPALYAIGRRPIYNTCFHDITTGSNAVGDPDRYKAVPGYDLCTGWGTPNGMPLINALALGMPFNTNVPTAATSFNNVVFDYAADLDGRVYSNQATYGEAFKGWSELPGGLKTNSAPACAHVNTSLLVFIRSLDNRLYLNQAVFGHDFSGWTEVQGNGTTDAAPAAASINNTVYLFVKGMDGKIYENPAIYGYPFSGWVVMPGSITTNTAPAVVAHNNTLYVFIRGLDGKIYKNEADAGHPFGIWTVVPGDKLTDVTPAVATINNTLYVIIKGTDNRIYKTEADFGHSFGPWTELQGNGFSDAAPTATTVGQTLFVFIKGTDDKVYLNQAVYRKAFSGWFDVGGRYY